MHRKVSVARKESRGLRVIQVRKEQQVTQDHKELLVVEIVNFVIVRGMTLTSRK